MAEGFQWGAGMRHHGFRSEDKVPPLALVNTARKSGDMDGTIDGEGIEMMILSPGQ